MRSLNFKAGSGRIVIAVLGLVFLKALGQGLGGLPHTGGQSAEADVETHLPAPLVVVPPAADSPKSDIAPPR